MTIMQAVLYPPLDDEEEDYDNQHPTISNKSSSNNSCSNTAGVVPNLMSPELRARFETLKRLRDESNVCHATDNNDNEDDEEEETSERGEESPSNRRRLELATETALAAEAEIARMHQAVAELEGLLHDNERNNNLDEDDDSGNDEEEEELFDDDEDADYCPPGKPVAMISFPRLPQVVVFDEDPRASDPTFHDIKGEQGDTNLLE